MILKRKINDILSPRVVAVTLETPVSEAVRILRREQISCVVVLDGFVPKGMFTERDILRSTVQHGNGFLGRPISEVMSTPLVTVTRDTFVYEAYNLLASNQLRHLVVVDDKGRAIGVVTESNLVEHLGLEHFLEIKKIFQIMTKMVYTTSPKTLLGEVMHRMAVKAISCVIVAEDNRPVGILTERDVARLVQEHEDVTDIPISQVMSAPVLISKVDTPVHTAAQVMKTQGVRRLVVVDGKGEIEGILTQTDIVRGLEGRYVEILKEVIQEKDVQLRETVESLFEKTIYLDNILTSSIDMGIVAANDGFVVTYANPAAGEILGCGSKKIDGRPLTEILKNIGVAPALLLDAAQLLIHDHQRHTVHFERRLEGETRYIRAVVSGIRDKGESLVGYVLMLRDVTEQKKAEETIRFLAYHDMLTGLPNRALFADRLNMAMARAIRYNKIIGVMVLDLDDFKSVNDTMGHAAGDLLLKSIARLLEGVVRRTDTVARMGGDEFFVLIADIDSPEGARTAGEKVSEALKGPFLVDGHSLHISASIGIAVYPGHGEDAEELIRKADQAMYRAKEQGRDTGASCVCMLPVAAG